MFTRRTALILLFCTALSGCDNNYHAFDGNSGYHSKMITPDHYSIQYSGGQFDTQRDVAAKWHHRAREICRGSYYQADYMAASKIRKEESLQSGEILPRASSQYLLRGKVFCLAPNLALKRAMHRAEDGRVADIR